MKYPYSDDFMYYDFNKHRYILTEKDVEVNLGIDLASRNENANVRRAILNTVSEHVYNFIHSFNKNTTAQDYIIAKTKSGREIIKEAMENQLVYVLSAGDLSRVPDPNLRLLWFDEQAKQILFRDIPEIGTSICYAGSLSFIAIDGEF